MWLDMCIEMVKTDITNSLQKLGKLNVSLGENDAFLSLLHNDDIVIRPADKGSGIVVLDKVKYIQSLQKEMEESDFYDVTDEDRTQKSLREVKKQNVEGWRYFKRYEAVLNTTLPESRLPEWKPQAAQE